jgi:hypothetical protein
MQLIKIENLRLTDRNKAGATLFLPMKAMK